MKQIPCCHAASGLEHWIGLGLKAAVLNSLSQGLFHVQFKQKVQNFMLSFCMKEAQITMLTQMRGKQITPFCSLAISFSKDSIKVPDGIEPEYKHPIQRVHLFTCLRNDK